jgi:hypothetical protein
MLEVLQLPRLRSSSFVFPSLALIVLYRQSKSKHHQSLSTIVGKMKITYFNSTLLPTSTLKITLPNPTSNKRPQFPAFPLCLFFYGLDGDLFLVRGDIVERESCRGLRGGVPRPFDDQRF